MIRNLVRKCSPVSTDMIPDKTNPSLGNRVSARAVTAPVAASITIPTPPQTNTAGTRPGPGRGSPRVTMVRVRAASSNRVLTRWSGTATTRAREASSATHSEKTIRAPISASPMIATTPSIAIRRTRRPVVGSFRIHHHSPTTRPRATPEIPRCTNSTAVAPASSGIISP